MLERSMQIAGQRKTPNNACILKNKTGDPLVLAIKKQLKKIVVYSWERNHLRSKTFSDVVNAFHVNPTLSVLESQETVSTPGDATRCGS